MATCPDGYTFNSATQICEKTAVSAPLCPTWYTYNVNTQTCTLVETSLADCDNYLSVDALVGVSTGASTTETTSFKGKTTQEIKCISESSSSCILRSRSFYVETLPLFIGQQLYGQSGGYYPVTTNDSFIFNIPTQTGGCRGLTTTNLTQIVEVIGGIITNISQYQTVIC